MKNEDSKPGLPLGKREDQGLEFKGKDSASDLKKIAREVVAMLNASGGEIWIGIREAESFAVATEPLADAHKVEDSLWDHLVETVEPAPSGKEVGIEVIPLEGKRGGVLRILVRGRERKKPYALLGKGGSRAFLLRVGRRIRPMDREEIFSAATGGSGPSRVREREEGERAMDILREAREEALGEEDRFLWIGIQPEGSLVLDLDKERKEKLVRILKDPAETDCRPQGWGFANPLAQVKTLAGGYGLDLRPPNKLEIREDGGIRFQREIGAFLADRKKPILNGLALLETAVSLFRLARALYLGGTFFERKPFRILADAALVGVKGFVLPPGTLDSWIYWADVNPAGEAPSDLVLLPRPLEVSREELEDPFPCGFKLVRRLYRVFGLDAEDVPVDPLRALERSFR